MRKQNYIILGVLFIFLLGCEKMNLDVELFGSISGVIIDGENYEPIQGVLISTSPASSSLMTNVDGEFLIDKVKIGDITITARKKDFLSNSATIAVYEAEETSMTIYLLKDENNIGHVELYDPVPGNGAVDQNLSLTLQWKVDRENHGGDLSYSVYFFEANSNVQKIAGENLLIEEVVISGLKYETSYYWYVVAKYDGDDVAYSPTWTFSTIEKSD